MSSKKNGGITLTEILIVLVIIGIFVALALPQLTASRERSLSREAKANLKLISTAEQIYHMEATAYYPASGSESNIANITSQLNVNITETNWDYAITGGSSTFTVSANRQGTGGYLDCTYSITQADNEATGNSNCP